MSRSRFRSQPALQRSGGGIPFATLGLWLAVAVVSLGAVMLFRGMAADQGHVPPTVPIDQPVELAAVETPTPPAPTTTPVTSVPASPQAEASRPPSGTPKARKAARAPQGAKPPNYPTLEPSTPRERWERQRRDYERAREIYDANERAEGRRWAQQNRIRLQRHCRAAQTRSSAFVDGCMSYVRPTLARLGAASDRSDDQPASAASASDHAVAGAARAAME